MTHVPTQPTHVPLQDVFRWTDEIRSEFVREEDQAILQRNMDKAIAAVSGKDACDRLTRCIKMRFGMWRCSTAQSSFEFPALRALRGSSRTARRRTAGNGRRAQMIRAIRGGE